MNHLSLVNDAIVKPFSHQAVYRNIPTNTPSRHLFGDDFSDSELAVLHYWADQGSGIDHQQPVKDRWYDYADPEDLSFCFDQDSVLASRYTDGSRPAWYGAIQSEQASRAETIYHLQRQARLDLAPEEEYICFQRAMCRAAVACNKSYDLRRSLRVQYQFLDDPPYHESNKIGTACASRGSDGILYPSKRYADADCIAVFSKRAILESRVVNFFSVEVYSDRLTICGESMTAEFRDRILAADRLSQSSQVIEGPTK